MRPRHRVPDQQQSSTLPLAPPSPVSNSPPSGRCMPYSTATGRSEKSIFGSSHVVPSTRLDKDGFEAETFEEFTRVPVLQLLFPPRTRDVLSPGPPRTGGREDGLPGTNHRKEKVSTRAITDLIRLLASSDPRPPTSTLLHTHSHPHKHSILFLLAGRVAFDPRHY